MRVSARQIAVFGATALALANLGRVPAGALAGRDAPITLADFAALLVWFAVFIALLTGRARPTLDGVMSSALTFVAVATLSAGLAVQRYGLGFGDGFEVFAFLARWVLYFGWYPFVAHVLSADEARDADRFTTNALFAICAFGVFQAFFLPEFGTRIASSGLTPSWEYQGRRLVSSLLDPNFAGAMAVLALLPALALVTEGRRVPPIALIVPAAAIVLTASRSSVLAFAAGFGVIVLARGFRVKLLKTVAAGVLLMLPLLPLIIEYGKSMNKFSVDTSAAQRFVTWTRAFTLFAEHPWLGIGFNASKAAQEARGWIFIGGADTGFDGGLFFVMVMTGVVGATVYAMLLGRSVLASRRAWRDASLSPEDRAHGTTVAASVVAILVHSMFSNSLLLPFVMQVLWTRFGRLAHISAERRRRLGLAVAIPVVLAVGACSPCGGVAQCNSDYLLRLEGSLRSHVDGRPVANAVLDVTFRGTEGDRQRRTTTDAEGLWSVEAPGNCCENFHAQVRVSAPGQPSFLTPAISMRGSNLAGEALVLEPWIDRPSIKYGIVLNGPGGAPLADATATFTRTDGVQATVLLQAVDGSGIFHIEMVGDRTGDVIGTLTVNHAALAQPFTQPGLTIPLEFRYRLPPVINMSVGATGAMNR